MNTNGTSRAPFRAAAIERYARTSQATLPPRPPLVALLVILWLLLVLALATCAAWLTVAWRYLAT